MIEASTVEEKIRVAKEAWSTGRLIDELFLELDNVKEIDEKIGLTKRKYEEQAKWLMHRLLVYRPALAFIINLSDLSTRIKEELAALNNELLNDVMLAVICRIFENIDERYFRLSARRFLKWEISK